MALSSTSFVNGQIGNPNGRPLGSRNKRTKEIIQLIIESNNKDPLITLSEISSNDPDSAIRATAANMLAPYMHSKMQSTPAPRFIEDSLGVPEFTHLSDAESFLAKIAALVARGHLDIQSGQELSALIKTWIDTQYARDELNYKISPPETRDQTIRIEGGLPALPGTSITMPVLNGHAVAEQLLSAPNDVIPSSSAEVEGEAAGMNSTNDLSPGELNAQGPHPLQKHHFAPEEPNFARAQNSPGMNSTGNGSPETKDQEP
jgi:hypothetical protein